MISLGVGVWSGTCYIVICYMMCDGVQNVRLKEKEQKLSRELDRLRSHLLQIEEGYTREALEAEEREKTLRNRLAHAEEQLSTTASQVQSARSVIVK